VWLLWLRGCKWDGGADEVEGLALVGGGLDSRCSYLQATISAVGLLGGCNAWKISRAM
jgi:hypothetical protein